MLALSQTMPGMTYTEHAKSIIESIVAVCDMPLDLIALKIPLDKRAMILLLQEPMYLSKGPGRCERDYELLTLFHAYSTRRWMG